MEAIRPALVILAAGASRRLGQPKALAALSSLPGDSPLARLLDSAAVLNSAPPLIVTGHDHASIRQAMGDASLYGGRDTHGAWPTGLEPELLHNPEWERGRTGGIALALSVRPGRDLCIAQVDTPLVPAIVFHGLAGAWEAAGAPPRGWLAPSFSVDSQPRFGHPIILGGALAAELAGFTPDQPLRDLRRRAGPTWSIEVQTEAILDNLDTPADLESLRARIAAVPRARQGE